ncbi:MAG: hypothetical protein ABFS32_23140 [Bacteroidota bacterium]
MNRVKYISIICALCFSGFSSTNAQRVFSFHSLFTEQDAELKPEIEGLWTMPVFDWTMSLKKAGDNFYHFIDNLDDPTYIYEAAFVKLKGELLIDLRGVLPENMGDNDFRNSFLPFHSIYKSKISGDTLFISSLNYSWFYNYAVTKELPLKFKWVSNGILLTYATEELQSFFAEHIHEDGIFDEPGLIIVDNDHFNGEKDIIAENSGFNPSASLSQKCTPSFPFKDGWLGGDGDVSVPINDTSTIFIFSDTYVGNKDQKSRQEPGMGMVANTLAIQTCSTNGESDIQYYWNKMYSDNPKPFFRSFTDRYKYWVVDAFTANRNLYVILSKIGSQFGSPPDNIYNFSGLGFTLAKISNLHDVPHDWKIELFPLPDFISSTMEIRCHAKQDGYIYLFISRNDTSQFVVRKQIDLIDDHERPFEYYALNKEWKQGIEANDMLEIAKGFRCNSVNFHPEIRQWAMISDIRFKDNKIKMRTAPELTGPWSNEIVIYEIPEVTPGNSLYSKSNFCYLAREHIQYYDSKNLVMLLTYDINNTNYSEILLNPKIYTPKIITVPLKNNGSR